MNRRRDTLTERSNLEVRTLANHEATLLANHTDVGTVSHFWQGFSLEL